MKIKDCLGFKAFYIQNENTKLPITLAYKLNKILSSISEEINFYSTKFNEYVNKYAERDENDNIKHDNNFNIIIKPEFNGIAQKAIEELNEIEVNYKGDFLTLDELQTFNLSLIDLQNLIPFIKEEKPTD